MTVLYGPLMDASFLDTIVEWFKNPETLLVALGPWVLGGVALIVFIESGVLFPVLPGDSLVFSAGLLHSQLGLSLLVLILTITICAVAGSQVGYWLGAKFGRRLFSDEAKFLKTEYLHQAEDFFNRYGGRALVLGRFVPFVRTFVPLAAGIARFHYVSFTLWNLVGAILWGAGLTYLGAALGGVQFIHDNLTAIILIIVFVSLLPMVVEILLQRRRAAKQGGVPDPHLVRGDEAIAESDTAADTDPQN